MHGFTDGFGAMKLILNYESICNEKMGSMFFVFLVFVSCLFFVYHNGKFTGELEEEIQLKSRTFTISE